MKYTREQKRARLLAEAQAVIEEFLDWEEQAGEPKLTVIEDEVLVLRERFGQRLAETALDDQDAKQPAVAPTCASCGQPMRYKGQKELATESRVGLLRFVRGYYHCARCHSGLFPPGRPVGVVGLRQGANRGAGVAFSPWTPSWRCGTGTGAKGWRGMRCG